MMEALLGVIRHNATNELHDANALILEDVQLDRYVSVVNLARVRDKLDELLHLLDMIELEE